MKIDFSQFRDLFVDESQGYLRTIIESFLALEVDPGSKDAIDTMFRAAHTLKGASATMGFEQMALLTHAVEDALHALRHSPITTNDELIEALSEGVFLLQSIGDDIAAGGDGAIDIEPVLHRLQAFKPDEVRPAPTAPEPASRPQAPQPAAGISEHQPLLRVKVSQVDDLLQSVTEIMTHRRRLDEIGKQVGLPDLTETLKAHGRLLANLQRSALRMRVVPVTSLFSRYPKMARDLLKSEGKLGRMTVDARDAELDRAVIDILSDPLYHLVRNAVHHGIEPPDERERAGKPRAALIKLSAYPDHDTVVIEISDDGRGLDKARILQIARDRGLRHGTQGGLPSDDETLDLICHPGFTTCSEVSATAGRGIGMNVVRQQVEAARGLLTARSLPGQGTTFSIQVPTSLSLLHALLVAVGPEEYAIPAYQVKHVVSPEASRIERIGAQELLQSGGRAIPLLSARSLLATHTGTTPGDDDAPERKIIIARDVALEFGLKVTDVLGYEEVVAQPLPRALRGIAGLGAVTTLGNRRPTLVLDLSSL